MGAKEAVKSSVGAVTGSHKPPKMDAENSDPLQEQ